MLFRTMDGKLIEINKYDFKNDKLYYQKIMSLYYFNSLKKEQFRLNYKTFNNKNT